jgi:hypothetical protein
LVYNLVMVYGVNRLNRFIYFRHSEWVYHIVSYRLSKKTQREGYGTTCQIYGDRQYRV